MSKIEFSLCGGYKDDEQLNPYAVTKPETRQEILGLINREHSTPESIAETLALSREEASRHLESLEKAGLAERTGQLWKPAFAIFTERDQEELEPLLEAMADSYMGTVRDSMNTVRETYEACRFAEHGFSTADLDYILVGAYVLDFGGLALDRAGLLLAEKEMPGGAYVFTGFEGQRRNLRASWMWGHTAEYGPFTFIGHGELPSGRPRRAFPEQAYIWRREGRSAEEVLRAMEELGTILVELYAAPMTPRELASRTGIAPQRLADHLQLLHELEYIDHSDTATSVCPVVDEVSKARIQELVRAVWAGLLDTAVTPNWGQLERLYQNTAPARNGVGINEAFNPIHHAIFERALRKLMEGGIIAWPGRHTDGARYTVWIEHVREGKADEA